MIDRVLFGWMGRVALDSVGRTPCLVGWSPVRGGWKLLQAYYDGKEVLCMDKSAWDWTVPFWMIDLFKNFVKALPYRAPGWWLNMVDMRFRLLFEAGHPVFEFSDGLLVRQQEDGVMKSGCFLTILLNSVCQSFCHYLTNIKMGISPRRNQPHTVGDDTVQVSFQRVEEYVRVMSSMGIHIKGYKIQHWVEFCGYAYTDQTCFPAYWQKHLYNLMYSDHLRESIKTYQTLYVHEPVMWRFLQRIARELGPQYVMDWFEARSIFDDENQIVM